VYVAAGAHAPLLRAHDAIGGVCCVCVFLSNARTGQKALQSGG